MTRTADPFDELAAMFLTAAEGQPATGGGAGGTAPVLEMVLVGHLPVRAALWLTPYADAVARREGPAALVRMDGGAPTIEVLRGDEREPRAPEIGSCRNLREAILLLGPSIRAWIVRPAPGAPPAEVLGGASGPAPDRITILSSADQVAVVNVYTLIKELAECADPTCRPLPEIGLAVLGSDREQAMKAARGVDLTTREYLDLPVPLTMTLPRIDASVRSGRMRSFPGEQRPALEEVLAWVAEARRRAAEEPAGTAGPETAPVPHLPSFPPEDRPTPAVAEADLPPPPEEDRPLRAEPAAPSAPAAAAARPEPAAKLEPKAGAEVEVKDPRRPAEPEDRGRPRPLAEHVADPTRGPEKPGHLQPLAPRCPGHERIELAVDARGRMHLLGREDSFREMPVVAAWARAHRELIAMACPGRRFDPAALPAQHLFTDRPLRVADLYGASLHLHVLAPVDIHGGSRGWYAATLYEPPRPAPSSATRDR